MTTKLTLSMQKEVIEAGKKYAKKQGVSLSNIIETYLKEIAGIKDKGIPNPESDRISPEIKNLMGIAKGFDLSKSNEELLAERYLKS